MTVETKELLLRVIKQELDGEEQCGMLKEHKDYVLELIKAEKEILDSMHRGESAFIKYVTYGAGIEADIERYIKEVE